MVVYNYSGKEINAKIVYYGPALSGKTTNLEWIYSKIPLEYSGKMISLRTQTDRTIFFDFLPLELGLIDGFKTRFMLYTVPGQVYYNATRKMVLKGADGVVFVADSAEGRLQDNLESLQNLHDNLAEIGIDPLNIPIVMQWNKRDLPDVMEAAYLERELNPMGYPSFSGCALTGEGVYESLHQISRMIYRKLTVEEDSAAREFDEIDADSLFGKDIAERLRDVDHPDPTLDNPVSLKGIVDHPAPSEGDVLNTILGSLASHGPENDLQGKDSPAAETSQSPSPEGEDEPQPLPTPEAAVGLEDETHHQPAPEAAAGPENEVMAEPELAVVSGESDPGAGSESETQPMTPPGGQLTMSQMQTPPPGSENRDEFSPAPNAGGSPAQTSAPQNSDAPVEDEAVAELVDQLFTPASPESSSDDPASEEHAAYGPEFGRMVDLDSKSPQSTPAPADEDFELPEDLLESGIFRAVEPAEETAERLELITDPRKLPSESKSAPVSPLSSDFQTGSLTVPVENARVIELPVTVDASLLESGKSLRIVLNLKIQR